MWGLTFPGGSAGKESTRNAGDLGSIPGSGKSTGEGIGYPFQYFGASLVAQLVKNPSAMKETACSAGSLGSIPGLGGSPGGGHGNPLQYSCLENSMDRRVVGYCPLDCKESDTTEVT